MPDESFEVIDKRKVRVAEGVGASPADVPQTPPEAPEPPSGGEQSSAASAPGAEPSSDPTAGAAEGPERETSSSAQGDAASAQEGGVSGQEAEDFRIPPELLAPDLPVLIVSMIEMLATQAWWLMGLTRNPRTGKVEKEMPKAKLAIDCVQFLVDKVAPMVEEPVRRELRHRLSDLQINFVEQGRTP